MQDKRLEARNRRARFASRLALDGFRLGLAGRCAPPRSRSSRASPSPPAATPGTARRDESGARSVPFAEGETRGGSVRSTEGTESHLGQPNG
jgi:hypothetical protein